MYYTVSSNYEINHHLLPPPGVPNHHHHQKVFGHLTPTLSMSLLRLGGFWFLTWHKFKIIFLSCRLSELFRPWRSTPFTVVFFYAGFHIEVHVVVSNVYRFILLFWWSGNQRRKHRKKYKGERERYWWIHSYLVVVHILAVFYWDIFNVSDLDIMKSKIVEQHYSVFRINLLRNLKIQFLRSTVCVTAGGGKTVAV